jgi:hypothetical protein
MAVLNLVVEYSAARGTDADASVVYCGYDFGKAKDLVAQVGEKAPRRELYRGGMPYISRVFRPVTQSEASATQTKEEAPEAAPAPEPKKAKK